jgi:hypothetical protein
MTDQSLAALIQKIKDKSLAKLAGLFCLLVFITACQTAKTPEQVTTAFWQAIAQADLDTAKKLVSPDTQQLVHNEPKLENSTLQIGQIIINGVNATVATTLTLSPTENNRVLSFNTVLLKQNDQWQIDYQQTLHNLANQPFSGIIKSLEAIGDTLNRQLQQQIPLIEQEIESFGKELQQQLDEFGRQLEKPNPPEKRQPYRDTI